jgi:hypothetical protein
MRFRYWEIGMWLSIQLLAAASFTGLKSRDAEKAEKPGKLN